MGKQKTTLGKVFLENLIDLFFSVLSGLVGFVFSVLNDSFNIPSPYNFIFAVAILFTSILAIMFLVVFILNLILTLPLFKKGKSISLIPKSQVLSALFTKSTKKDNPLLSGKVYKNEDGIIFKVVGCKCPFCKSKPIGFMKPKFRKSNNIIFVCNNNSEHTQVFDYKKVVLQQNTDSDD